MSAFYTTLSDLIGGVNTLLWSYILVALLLFCAFYFTLRSGFVQFRLFGEQFRLLGDSGPKDRPGGGKKISSFQAFAVSLASRVGTGNLAGVATAIVVGGPGAVFWMWLIALMGAATGFIESTLAQLYKVRGRSSFRGGPAYYMKQGLKQPWMGAVFAILIALTFGYAFNTVQSNTMSEALSKAFGFDKTYVGLVIAVTAFAIIWGGIQSIARFSSVIVPIMALGYLGIAVVVIAMNISAVPSVFRMIFTHAFGMESLVGGGMGAAVMNGIKRGLFSNEAGMGSAPNAAATATISHPVKQGLIQALGVFIDTIVICSCTAFIILCSGVDLASGLNGAQLTQEALSLQIGDFGTYFIAIALIFFAFSSIIGNYYYGETNIRHLTKNPWVMKAYKITVGIAVFLGAVMTLDLAWGLADVFMGLTTILNLITILFLGKYAVRLLRDYLDQKRQGIKDPVFHKSTMPDIMADIECWDDDWWTNTDPNSSED
ncbi:MAG: sodium:alanine symporter [Bacteroidia bacterium]|nr:MAG: sodium:alanine symporter [Bacteroidia bacterium]